ncbi:MAG TPA: hypothetical protein VIY86_03705, partial [Pirellulaceae bacterium]
MLFESVFDLDPGERARRLRSECGRDAGLLSEVQSLLNAHARAGEFLAEPTEDHRDRVPPREAILVEEEGTVI